MLISSDEVIKVTDRIQLKVGLKVAHYIRNWMMGAMEEETVPFLIRPKESRKCRSSLFDAKR